MSSSPQSPASKDGGETVIPRHVAIIMDGNNRWARRQGLPGPAGHRAGVETVREVLRACRQHGVEILTLFAFSSENWGRPQPEVKDRQVILVDDGLASGYTMLAAVDFMRQKEARQVIVAVPTASQRTVHFLLPKTDVLLCLNVRGGPVFAVADGE